MINKSINGSFTMSSVKSTYNQWLPSIFIFSIMNGFIINNFMIFSFLSPQQYNWRHDFFIIPIFKNYLN